MRAEAPGLRLLARPKPQQPGGDPRQQRDQLPVSLQRAWEHRVDSHAEIARELGSDLPAHLAVLWAVAYVAGLPADQAPAILEELIDDELRPRFSD